MSAFKEKYRHEGLDWSKWLREEWKRQFRSREVRLAIVLLVTYQCVVIVASNSSIGLNLTAKMGCRSSQHELGWRYVNGIGVIKDSTEAIAWLTKAADSGDQSAQFYLGLLYLEGDEVNKDVGEATRWLSMAADQGYPSARHLLDHIEKNKEK